MPDSVGGGEKVAGFRRVRVSPSRHESFHVSPSGFRAVCLPSAYESPSGRAADFSCASGFSFYPLLFPFCFPPLRRRSDPVLAAQTAAMGSRKEKIWDGRNGGCSRFYFRFGGFFSFFFFFFFFFFSCWGWVCVVGGGFYRSAP